MRKIVFLGTLVLAFMAQNVLFAQDTDVENVNFTAILNAVFNLNVTGGQDQTATFTTADDYNLGVTGPGGGIVSGNTTITIETTGNWNLSIEAANFDDAGGQSIPIENLGVWCEATGAHIFGTEVTCAHTASADCHGVTIAPYTLIDLGTDPSGNSGDASDNAFTLNWEMGTMQGTMNASSMFDQMAAGDFGPGTYTTTVVLTLTELP